MDEGRRQGTARELGLLPGDLVEMTSKQRSEGGDEIRHLTLGMVLEGPTDNWGGATVITLCSSDPYMGSGRTDDLDQQYKGYTLLARAREVLPALDQVREALQRKGIYPKDEATARTEKW